MTILIFNLLISFCLKIWYNALKNPAAGRLSRFALKDSFVVFFLSIALFNMDV